MTDQMTDARALEWVFWIKGRGARKIPSGAKSLAEYEAALDHIASRLQAQQPARISREWAKNAAERELEVGIDFDAGVEQQPGAQAVAWALEQGGILADWCNTAGDALRSLMGAYERRVRSACASSADLDARPWRCAEYVQAEDALAIKPTPSVLVGNGKSDTHPQPPSIPEPRAEHWRRATSERFGNLAAKLVEQRARELAKENAK